MSILLRRDDHSRTEFWQDLLDLRNNNFCDLDLVCSGPVTIRCHRLVIASFSSLLRILLTEAKEEDAVSVVHLPDHSGKDVGAVIEGVYAMATKRRVTNAFRKAQKNLNDLFDFKPAELNFESVVIKEDPEADVEDKNFEEFDPDLLSFVDEQPFDLGSEDEKPLSRKRKRAVETKGRPNKRKKNLETDLIDEELEEVSLQKKARRKKPKDQKAILKFDDPVDSPGVKLYNVMKNANTTINVRLLSEQLKVSIHCNKKQRDASYFQVLVGLAKTEASPSQFEAKPLAWSLPDSNDITTQFDSTFAAFRELFGFSDGDMYYNSLLFSKQGLYTKNRGSMRRFELRGEYAKLFQDELASRLANEEIIQVTKRFPKKPDMIIQEDVDCELVLTDQMELDVMEGIAVLVWENASTQVTGRVIQIKEDKSEEEAKDCMKALFDVWCIGRKPAQIPDSEYLRNWYNKLLEPMEKHRVLKEFLSADNDFSQRKMILKKEKECTECGKMFPAVTRQDNIALAVHKKMHYYMNFKCDCKETFTAYEPKKNHVLLCHSNGKHLKCEHCPYIGSVQAMKGHMEKGHAFKCKECGKELGSNLALIKHRMTHRKFKCEHCEAPVMTSAAFFTHQRKHHPQELPENKVNSVCEVCGKKLASKKSLQRHMIGVHMDSKDRPHQCPDCDRGFPNPASMAAHRMIAHIKSRPFKCRYEGCEEAFNCNASRGTHEKQKHGEKFHIFQRNSKI